jgi:Protein of unknown function (DUF4236)
MGSFRFYRRVHVFPGLTVNLSKSGPSLSVGVGGAHVTVGRRGIRKTVGIPGTGIYYTSSTGHHTGAHSAHQEPLKIESARHRKAKANFMIAAIILAIAAVTFALSMMRAR